MDATDFRLPRQKHQDAAGFIIERFEYRLRHALINVFARLKRPPPAHCHRVHAALAAQDRRVAQQTRQALAFEGGGHQQDFQRLLVAKQLAAVKAQGQRQVGVEAALVEFVEDQQAHAIQCRVVLQAASENAFGDHFDAGIGANLAVETNAIPDGLPDLLAQLTGQSFRCGTRRQTTRLKHEDGLPIEPGFIEQRQGHAGGFTGAGRCFEHGFVACRQRFTQGG